MFDRLLTIEVGAVKKPYQFHEGILRHHSAYFKGAINAMGTAGFAQGKENMITITDTEIKVFESFRDWLYTGKLSEEAKESRKFLCKAWVFGDMRGIPMYKNAIMDSLIERCVNNWHTLDDLTAFIYHNTGEGSQLRRFAVDIVALAYSDLYNFASDVEDANERPSEYLLDVMRAYTRREKRLNQEAFRKIDKCRYHDHQDPQHERIEAIK